MDVVRRELSPVSLIITLVLHDVRGERICAIGFEAIYKWEVMSMIVCFKLLCKASSAPPVMLGVLVGSFLCGILSRMVEWLKEIIFHREESENV